ncbi:hypothetical protein ACQKP8_23440 [Photobacterium alginatilyticum]|uniref:hypothetical protein n=1 Tax=Photobacterium alginatilyticum TaxID=1775171 RepID=UPI004067D822
MAVITKKNEKVEHVVSLLGDNFSNEEFIAKFCEEYPNDWTKAEREYLKHERKTKPGKSHPCPRPEQYLINALSVWRKRILR